MEEEYATSAAACGGTASSCSSPRPTEGVHELGTPPFLIKTFEMVENPLTNSVISWSRAKNSFIVWDSHKFSTTLLPAYFKHSNFSSFICQLYTYGFRRVDPDRWEFANEAFLGGQKHLLKTMKRRRNVTRRMIQQNGGPRVELGLCKIEEEIERLKQDRNLFMSEIVKLKQQHHDSRERITVIEERMHSTDRNHQQMMNFLASTLANPMFELGQRRRFTMSTSTEMMFSAAPDEESSSCGLSSEAVKSTSTGI